MVNVNPVWRTHQKEQFGEQKYVTAELLEQFGKNEYYLYLLSKALDRGLPANIRQYFNIVNYYDEKNSYGADISGDYLQFNDNIEKRLFIDFEDLDYIDLNKTTADIISYEQTDAYGNKTAIKQVQLPKQSFTNINEETRTYSPWTIRDESTGEIISDDMTCNEHWYISWDRARPWETRPTWIQNPWSGEIPNICRAQTFTAEATGRLTDLTLSIKENIQGTPQEPLEVEIRRIEYKDGVATPMAPIPGAVLTSQKVFFNSGLTPEVYTVTFDNPPFVQEGEIYAWVLLSRPQLHPQHPYYVGGWSKSCEAEIYTGGDAFMSSNNSFTWTRYGKEDDTVDYHNGMLPPQDFAFIARIKTESSSYVQNTDKYLYLKPIISNPVKSVEINANDDIADSNTTIVYQVSNDGSNWITVPSTGVVNFDEHRRTIFVRAKLRSSINNTPRINSLNVILRTEASTEFYIRTKSYTPKLSGILGAATWSRIYCPIITEPSTIVTGEILSLKEVKEQFTLIDPEDLVGYLWIEELAKDEAAIRSDAVKYLREHPSAITILKQHNVYVTGEFLTSISFFNSPAYPNLKTVLNTPQKTVDNIQYDEWYDFTIDYEEDILTFYNPLTIPKGTLNVYFNPIILKGISPVELGRRDTNLEDNKEWDEEGLRIDNISETFIVDDNIIETRCIKLRLPPVDPIRHLYVNEVELMQDRDFIIDMKNRELEFIVSENTNESLLHLNDTIEVTYTPNIDDDSLTLAFFGRRTNLTKNAKIQNYTIDYKV